MLRSAWSAVSTYYSLSLYLAASSRLGVRTYQSRECRLASSTWPHQQKRRLILRRSSRLVQQTMQQYRQSQCYQKGNQDSRQVGRKRSREPAVLIVPRHLRDPDNSRQRSDPCGRKRKNPRDSTERRRAMFCVERFGAWFLAMT